MKKFDRLSPEQRKEEIKSAALSLFSRKGFAATTMENIVQQVSLSKGGVYRIYPSTAAILQDLMIDGMHLRNAFYQQSVQAAVAAGKVLDLPFFTDLICESLLIHPEISSIYVEFLWEKRRNPDLEALYQKVCSEALQETAALIDHSSPAPLLHDADSLQLLTNLMNTAILAIHILGLQDRFRENKDLIAQTMAAILAANSTRT